jgi:hypothetical protein
MRLKLVLAAASAALAGLVAATAVAASPAIPYSFLGTLSATPSGGHVSITVVGGSQPALVAMLGQPVAQTFAYDSTTQFLRVTNGVPSVVQASDLAAGDKVRVVVKASRGSSLATIESNVAASVSDLSTQGGPTKPEYVFAGKVKAINGSTIRLTVATGNPRALQLLAGRARLQGFAVDSSTAYIDWRGNVPTQISLSDIGVGDRVAIHVAAAAKSTLQQVEATPAAKVAEHEPAS